MPGIEARLQHIHKALQLVEVCLPSLAHLLGSLFEKIGLSLKRGLCEFSSLQVSLSAVIAGVCATHWDGVAVVV